MKKFNFNFPIKSIIEANLGMQAIQNALIKDYKILNPKIETITSEKFLSLYKSWNEEKKNDFLRTVAGRTNFKKAKNFFEDKD